jgi:hypothetical protein
MPSPVQQSRRKIEGGGLAGIASFSVASLAAGADANKLDAKLACKWENRRLQEALFLS